MQQCPFNPSNPSFSPQITPSRFAVLIYFHLRRIA
jgi:hypothetical protein